MDDMALLHHWTTSTSRTIVGLSGADYWWQEAFPRVAFGHPFLMHGILSLAALHLAHTHVGDDRKRYMADAARRQNLALPGFGQAIANMSEANSDAIFACASVNIAYVFGMYGDLYDSGNVGSSHSARNARVLGAEWIPMIRGIDAVLKPIYEHTRLGPLSPLLNLENWGELDPDSEEPDDTDRQMCKLRTIWDDGPDGELYDQTLYIMRKCYLYMRQFTRTVETAVEPAFYNRTWSGPMMWLVFLPEDFLIRLRQRQPAALVLFAYLGVMLHTVDNLWIFRGWGTNIVDVVDGILGDYFRPWMEWPKEAVGFTSRES
ncbi:hypothetical protein Daus18300_000145 [Diaporthe australafricana]|uniref:C6 zinc finger domain-containing protein n=1 Tax=Diaporthe australafricana TaxID=127596 RepID=A0ABR3Y7Y7_9PEZI